MKRKWFWIGPVVLIVLGAGAFFGFQQRAGESTAAAAAAGPADDIRVETEKEIVSAEGRVVPVREAMLASLSDGPVEAVFVAEGDLVQVGEVLVRLDTTDQEIAVRQAEAAVALAEANLASAESGLELAQIGLDSAYLAVRDAKADLALLEAGATDEQVTLTESAVALAEARIEQASGSRAVALEEASHAEIAAAQAEVAYALAEYDNALKRYQPILQNPDSDPDDRLQASLRLEAAHAALMAAQSGLDRLQAGATTSERIAADSGVTVATNQRDVAQAQLDLLLAGARSEQITIAKANVTTAETAVAEAEGRVTGAGTAVAQATAALVEAQAGLNAAEDELGKRSLIAPFGGTIAAVNIKEGEIIQAGLPVIVLADFSQWQIETTDLTELDVVALAQGLPAAVEFDAFPGVTLRGEVRDIAATAVVLRGDVTYLTTIDLVDAGDLPLRWGMTAFVQVLTDENGDLPDTTAGAPPVSRVGAQGRLVPQSYLDLALNTGGRVAAIPASEDDWVALDDALIELEADALQLALDQSDARVVAADAGLAAAQNQLALAETAVAKAEGALIIAQANLALVKAGPRSAEIAAAKAELAAAESAVTQAEAGRDVALDPVSDADIAAAEAAVAIATAELRALEENYQQILDACFDTPGGGTLCPLYGTVEEQTRGQLVAAQAHQAAAQALLDLLNAGPTLAQRSAAGGTVALAIANRDLAQAQLDLIMAAASPEQIERASVGVAQAELGIELAGAETRQAETAVMQAEAGLAAARAGRDAVQVALDRMTLRATMDGIVTSITPNPGEMVAPGTHVATLADLSGWLVETTDLSELDVPYISVGDPVEVRFDAIPDRVVTGVVTKIAEMSSLAQGDVVYQVTVRLGDAPDLPLRWGMTAFVDVHVE
jgi:multidrug resistance efflux pump